MKAAVVTFPGSNCDRDIGTVLSRDFKLDVDFIWHKDQFETLYDLVVLPGGFSYGDYLRCGAMARFSKVMNSVMSYSRKGGKVLGICNGFQILTEAGMLPGALTKNKTLKYICKMVDLKIGSVNPLTTKMKQDAVYHLPIAHGDGAYYADPETIKILEKENRILFTYANENPNGAIHDIAGITSKDYKTIGLMPHPERAMNALTGETDGRFLFESILSL